MNKTIYISKCLNAPTRNELNKQLNQVTHDYFSKEELESIRADFEKHWVEDCKYFNGSFWHPEEGRYTVMSEKQAAWVTWKSAIISMRQKDCV